MPEVFQKKTALVVSGGGSKGAFAVGAIEHLVENLGLRFDIVAGTSTGGLMAPLVVTGDIQRLKEIYTQITTPRIITPRPFAEAFIKHDALYDSTPALELIEHDLTEARARQIFDSDVQMIVTTINLNTGKTVFFQTGPPAVNNDPPHRSRLIHISDRKALIRAILATGSEPVFMPPIEIRPARHTRAYTDTGDPGADIKPTDRYVDGGVRDIAPIQIAIDNRATEIYAIVLSSRDRKRNEDPYTDLLTILTRTIDVFTQEITFKDVRIAQLFNQGARHRKRLHARLIDTLTKELKDKLKDLSPEEQERLLTGLVNEAFDAVNDDDPFKGTQVIDLYIIRPEEDLPGGSLEFDPGIMAQRLVMGRKRAREVLEAGPNILRVVA